MINWWPAEGNGTDVIGGNNGSLQNGLGFATGEVGSAFSFDGTNDSLSIGASAIPAPWTAEFWVNRQAAVQVSAVLLGDSATALKLEQFSNTQKVGVTVYGVQDYAFNYIAPVGVWTHLVFVGTTTNTQLYVNGALQDSVPVSIALGRAVLGNDIPTRNSRPIKGLVDEASIYNRVLSPAEIQALFNAGSAGKCGATHPPNDDFANAIQITGSSTSLTGSNVGATVQPNEPNHAGVSKGVSVWWKWTPPSNGRLKLDANGSSFGTTLAVYDGNSLDTLSEDASDSVAFNGGNFAAVNFNVFSGTTYYIAVDGFARFAGDPITGNVKLNLDFCPAPQILGFTTTQTVQSDGIHVLTCADVIGNVDNYNWFVVNNVEILSNFTANACFEVVVAATNEDQIQMELNATGPCGGTSGDAPPVVSCGICLSRGSPSLLTGSTGSGSGPVLTNKCGTFSSSARWFKMVSTNGTGLVQASTEGSANATMLAVYTGSIVIPNQLALLVCNDGVSSNKVLFNATQNSVYWVVADPHTTATGLRLATAFAQFPLTVTGLTANNKTYDGTTAATITGTPKLNGVNGTDSVTLTGTPVGTFTDKHAGNIKTLNVSGLTLSGADASQYTLTPLALTANITQRPLTLGGLTANNKTYDGTTSASLTGTVTLNGVLANDSVSTAGTAIAVFTDKNVGNNKSVNVSGLTLSGGSAADYSLSPLTLSANITPRSLTVNGLNANNKTYDGTTAATISGTATLSGAVAGDSVSTTGTATGTFSDKDVGNNKPVSAGGLALAGAAAPNYTLDSLTLSANITPRSLTVSGLAANNKVYDGTTTSTISGTATLSDIIGNDSVSTTGTPTGTFSDKNVGNSKPVTVSGLALGGTAFANYVLSPLTLSANIAPRPLTVTGLSANSKVYDGTTAATLSGSPALSGAIAADSVTAMGSTTGSFVDKHAGDNKPVVVFGLSLGGAEANNYSLTPLTLSANITPRSLALNGLTADNKIYDATTAASISGTAVFFGIIAGDSVTQTGTPAGSFFDKNVGNNKPVSVSGLQLGGTSAGDYALTPVTLSADITQRILTVTGITVADKIFDGGVSAQINTSAATLNGVLAADTANVSLDTSSATGLFTDKNVGNNIPVIIQSLQLTGSEAGNYILGSVTASGNIISQALIIGLPLVNSTSRSFSIITASGPRYTLEFKNSLSDATWIAGDSLIGDGTQKTLTDSTPTSSARFYRIHVSSP